MTSRRPVSASKATAWTRPASSGAAAARMASKSARTDPPAAGAAMSRGHHHADGRTEPERLAAVTAYDGGGATLPLLRLGGAVLLRRLPGRDEGLTGEVAPLSSPVMRSPPWWHRSPAGVRRGRAAAPSTTRACGLGAADFSCSCFSRANSRCSATRSLPVSAAFVAAATAAAPVGWCWNQGRPCSARYARRASASACGVWRSTVRASSRYAPMTSCAAWNAVNA